MRIATAAAAAFLALTLAACSGSGDDTPKNPSGDGNDGSDARSKILQPGRPGEANQTLDPDATVDSAEWNDADAMFVQMMISHHAQALEMCELARTRARDERVIALARRVEGAQGPEIVSMSSWLQARGLTVPTSTVGGHGQHGASDHRMAMPGLLSDAEMDALRKARDERFDDLFLAGMVKHHRGAVAMAGRALTEGSDLLANELANEIVAGQGAEIDRMQDLRSHL